MGVSSETAKLCFFLNLLCTASKAALSRWDPLELFAVKQPQPSSSAAPLAQAWRRRARCCRW